MFRVVGRTYSIPRAFLEKVALATFSFLSLRDADIELKFVSKREIIRLNSVYRGKTCATDVLSFTLDDKPLLGQIFICYTFMSNQARKLNKPVLDEAALLLVHGILHIAGFDHENDIDLLEMQTREQAILDKLRIKR